MEVLLALLSIVGSILSMACAIWLLVMAFKESLAWGFGSLCVPCVQFIFVYRNWPDTKKPFLGYLVGTLVGAVPAVHAGVKAGLDNLPFDPSRVDVPDLPADRGPPERVAPGVVRYTISLGPGGGFYSTPGHGGTLRLYLPEGNHAPGSLPCVLVTAAGTDGFVGTLIGGGDEPEQEPYPAAGIACVAYELDGPLPQRDNLTWNDMRRSYLAYRKAMGGLVNARNALEFVLTRVPEVDPKAIYTAGHSSAGSVALCAAAAEPRLAGAIAYAPPVDYAARQDRDWWADAKEMLPSVVTFARRVSPRTHVKKLERRPVFLFHARDDTVCDVGDTERLADALRAGGADVSLEVVGSGEHYDSMIYQGIPAAIAWLQARHPAARQAAPQVATEPRSMVERDAPRPPAATPEGLLRRASSGLASEQASAVQEWLDAGLDRTPGARADMVRALGPRVEPGVDKLLVRSHEALPIGTREALDCVPLAPPLLRKALVLALARRDPAVPTEEVAAVLTKLADDREATVEEALVRLGHAREGCARRLVLARGPEWIATPEGKALLEALPLARARDLLGAEEEYLRAQGAKLVTRHGAEDALPSLEPALTDAAPSVRQEVAGCLEALGDPRAAPLLARALVAEPDDGTKARLRRALSALPRAKCVEALVALLAAPEPGDRLAAVVALEAIQAVQSVDGLVAALRDTDRRVALVAARTLGTLRTSRTAGAGPVVEQRASEIGRIAVETRDAEVRRALRKLYFDIRGRLPEQDQPR